MSTLISINQSKIPFLALKDPEEVAYSSVHTWPDCDFDQITNYINSKNKLMVIFRGINLEYYDEKNVYWKGKKYSRKQMKEGAKNLPWEKEAYKTEKKVPLERKQHWKIPNLSY